MSDKRTNTGVIVVLLIVSLALIIYISVDKISDSKITGMATSDSQVGNLSVGVLTFLACTWGNDGLAVTFGTSLDPNTNNTNATRNYIFNGSAVINGTSYNATVDTLSNVAANFTLLGDHLVSGANTIAIGNVSWASNSTIANGTNMIHLNEINLTTSYDNANKVGSNIAVDSSVWYRFWIDVPSTTTAGTYVGNYTMQCTQAT